MPVLRSRPWWQEHASESVNSSPERWRRQAGRPRLRSDAKRLQRRSSIRFQLISREHPGAAISPWIGPFAPRRALAEGHPTNYGSSFRRNSYGGGLLWQPSLQLGGVLFRRTTTGANLEK